VVTPSTSTRYVSPDDPDALIRDNFRPPSLASGVIARCFDFEDKAEPVCSFARLGRGTCTAGLCARARARGAR